MASFELTQQLVQSLRQEQIMAPQQIQALEILLATVPELEQRINQELAENPTLEVLDTGSQSLVGNPVEDDAEGARDAGSEAAAEAAAHDESLATLVQLADSWRDYAPPRTYSAEDLERRQFMFDSLTAEPSLQEFLLRQLGETDGLDERMREICTHIIGSIDESGYLRTHPADLATALQTDMDSVRRGVALVQSFEPVGVGARDLRECLLLQLERRGQRGSLEYQLVDRHLEDLARNRIPQVAKALRTSPSHVYALLEKVRALDPFPGSKVSAAGVDFVYPEVFIERDGAGGWRVRSNRSYGPRLRIAPQYLEMLEDPAVSAADKRYLREKITSSRLLMRAIGQRQSTIERIAEAIIQFQRDFLDHGVAHMRPLVMSQVADQIGVHETTVSRAIANKYVQTPHGLFPFRHFFSTGYRSQDGEQVSSLAIKQKIQALVDGEQKNKPLSDQKLAAMLREQGFDVARRTVAKYREELGIAPSHLRRSF
jgi:RNA polymerase sigma-54 factor